MGLLSWIGLKRGDRYPNLDALMRDLRAMGETNALASRHRMPMPRAMLGRAAQLYADNFADAQGRIGATVETLVLTGWAPADTQPQPLRPGSAAHRLAEALGTTETGLEPAPFAAPGPSRD